MMVRHHSDNGTGEIIVRCDAISMGQIHNEFSTQVRVCLGWMRLGFGKTLLLGFVLRFA